jgi:hypothetical protein
MDRSRESPLNPTESRFARGLNESFATQSGVERTLDEAAGFIGVTRLTHSSHRRLDISQCSGLLPTVSCATEKLTLLCQRDPELPDVTERFAMHWIKCKPNFSLAVRRLLPWVNLSHSDSSTGFAMPLRAIRLDCPRGAQQRQG